MASTRLSALVLLLTLHVGVAEEAPREAVHWKIEALPSTSANQQALIVSKTTSQHLIVPDLDPKSDNFFFKTDYPDDNRPAVLHNFGHPYPKVQESDHFDKDFVKDDNDDHGEWKAQEAYDRLRTKVSKERADYEKALAKEHEEDQELAAAAKAQNESEGIAETKKEKAADARNRAEQADRTVANSSSELVNATAKVEEEAGQMEECRKQLADARENLKRLLEEKQERLKEMAERDGEAANKLLEAKEQHQKVVSEQEAARAAAQARLETTREAEQAREANRTSEAEGEVSSVQAEFETAQKELHDLRKKVAKEEGEHEEALKGYEEEVEEVKKTQKDMDAAAEKLRQFRHKVDPNGGVYRSDAASLIPSALLLMPIIAAVA